MNQHNVTDEETNEPLAVLIFGIGICVSAAVYWVIF